MGEKLKVDYEKLAQEILASDDAVLRDGISFTDENNNEIRIHRKLIYDPLYSRPHDIYFAGAGIFGKISEGKLVKILTADEPKLPGSNKSLLDSLFEGQIFEIEHMAGYNRLISLYGNGPRAIGIYYYPDKNEFYIAPRLVKKALKLSPDNKIIEIEVPRTFAKDDKEDFNRWKKDYGLLSKFKSTH